MDAGMDSGLVNEWMGGWTDRQIGCMHAWTDEIMEKIILLEAFPGFYANPPFTVWNLL